jgi:hypothetical protein
VCFTDGHLASPVLSVIFSLILCLTISLSVIDRTLRSTVNSYFVVISRIKISCRRISLLKFVSFLLFVQARTLIILQTRPQTCSQIILCALFRLHTTTWQ